jgi:hypothetical protein
MIDATDDTAQTSEPDIDYARAAIVDCGPCTIKVCERVRERERDKRTNRERSLWTYEQLVGKPDESSMSASHSPNDDESRFQHSDVRSTNRRVLCNQCQPRLN